MCLFVLLLRFILNNEWNELKIMPIFFLFKQKNRFFFAKQQKLVRKMLSIEFANEIREKIDDTTTSDDPRHYGGQYRVIEDKGTSHVSILGPNGDAISVTTSINS